MKKISIISIILIFIASVCVIGFFGVKLKVYEPISYVESITWDTTELERNKEYKIEKFEEEKESEVETEPEATTLAETSNEEEKREFDAQLKFVSNKPLKNGVKMNIKCLANPANATNPILDYYMDVQENSPFSYNVLEDNTCDVTFKDTIATLLTVKATDGKGAIYRIKFIIVDLTNL